MTRCKVVCTNTNSIVNGSKDVIHNAELVPVIDGSPENKEFFKWTPSGGFKINTTNRQHFEAGKQYYVDFTLVE